MKYNTDNVRIISSAPMVSPNTLIKQFPQSEKASKGVFSAREVIKEIIYGEDKRLMVLVGPCSIHDTKAAIEYANKLVKLKEELDEDLEEGGTTQTSGSESGELDGSSGKLSPSSSE